MEKGYWMVNADISNMEELWKYRAANREVMTRYNAKFLVMHGEQKIVEGVLLSKQIIVEFPSYQDALDCYYSDEYQQAARIREAVAVSNMVIVKGYEGPQGMDL